MSNVINLAERRLVVSERRYFDEIAADIRAGIDVEANIEELEGIEANTTQLQLRAACSQLLAQCARASGQ